jgi:hypothetical protein
MELLIAAAAIVALGAIWYVNRKTGLDVNQDGKVDLADAKAAVENTAAAVVQAADANNDGKVDAEDVKVVAKKAKTGATKAATKAKETVKKATTRGRKPKAK